MDKLSAGVVARRARAKPLQAGAAVAAVLVRLDLEAGLAPEAMRATLATPRARALLEEGLRALGAHVVAFTTSPAKTEDALRLGAHEVVVSRNAKEMGKHAGSFDMILDTVSALHELQAYLHLLRREGNLTLVGAPDQPHAVPAFGLIFGNKSLSGSLIGGIQPTQELLDFCGEHGITADVEVVPVQKLDEAYERLLRSDVKYRFSIDMASLRAG